LGEIYTNIVGVEQITTDRDGNDVSKLSSDVSSRALHVSEAKKEIWSDDYLLWYDDMETKSGACIMCKWRGGFYEQPYTVPAGTVGMADYVQGDWPDATGVHPYYIPPKEGNWMLRLRTGPGQQDDLLGADCYTKLGEIDNKRIMPKKWNLYVDNEDFKMDVNISSIDYHYISVPTVNYWRYHVKNQGYVIYDSEKKNINSIDISEYLKFL
jgi:hypothetical protein